MCRVGPLVGYESCSDIDKPRHQHDAHPTTHLQGRARSVLKSTTTEWGWNLYRINIAFLQIFVNCKGCKESNASLKIMF